MIIRASFAAVLSGLLFVGDEAPQAVRDAVKHHAGGATIEELEQEREHGVIVWAAEWEADGREHEVKLLPDGELVELEWEVDEGEVPEHARAAIRSKTDVARIEWVRKTIVVYEATVVKNGREHDMHVMATGALLAEPGDGDDEQEVALADVPRSVMAAAEAALPGVVFTSAWTEMEGGVLVYELVGDDVEIELNEAGEVLEIERAD